MLLAIRVADVLAGFRAVFSIGARVVERGSVDGHYSGRAARIGLFLCNADLTTGDARGGLLSLATIQDRFGGFVRVLVRRH
jgi:hypothetical protein